MAALMVLFNHVKDDISSLYDNVTLLNTPIFFVKVAGNESNKQGAYLHCDNNDDCWVRSGKVTGRGLKVRNDEHLKKAKAKQSASKFYLRYPTKCRARSNSTRRKGLFDNLTQFVAVGFVVANDKFDRKVSLEYEQDGIFLFNESEKTRINASNKADRNMTALKRIDMIAYLIDIAYNIAISPVHNVSDNLGFELYLNIYSSVI